MSEIVKRFGYEFKKKLMSLNPQHEWQDLGAHSTDSVDYPDYAKQLCAQLKNSNESFGVLICGSGQGMAIAANRHPHIRAALCWSEEVAKLSRAHNNANVLCLGSRLITIEVAQQILKVFLTTQYEGGRHDQRVAKLS